MAFEESPANKQIRKRVWIDDIKSISVSGNHRNKERTTKFQLRGHIKVNSKVTKFSYIRLKVTTQVAVYGNKKCAEEDKGRFMEELLRKRNRGEAFNFVTNEAYEERGLPVPSLQLESEEDMTSHLRDTSRSRGSMAIKNVQRKIR